MKHCRDNQCRRKGILLSLDEFSKSKRNKSGGHSYCRECAVRRAVENRVKNKARRAAIKARRNEQQQRLRAAKAKIKTLSVTERVFHEIEAGKQTFDEIAAVTCFHEDAIGDAVAQLWDRDRIRIVERKFYPARRAA